MAASVWQAHNPNTGKDCNPETYGGSGEKEPMPPEFPSMASDDGYHELTGQNAAAAFHKSPAVNAIPDNLDGAPYPAAAGDSGNPSAAEGGTGPEGY